MRNRTPAVANRARRTSRGATSPRTLCPRLVAARGIRTAGRPAADKIHDLDPIALFDPAQRVLILWDDLEVLLYDDTFLGDLEFGQKRFERQV